MLTEIAEHFDIIYYGCTKERGQTKANIHALHVIQRVIFRTG
jgi:hypothetical protein